MCKCYYWKDLTYTDKACHFCHDTGHTRRIVDGKCLEQTLKKPKAIKTKEYKKGQFTRQTDEITEYKKHRNNSTVIYV